MKPFLTSISHALQASVLVRLGLAMGVLALLSFASIVTSTVIAENITGQASAINLSGSLRMMSFRSLSEVQQTEKRLQAQNTLEQFERRLLSLERFIHDKTIGTSPSAEAFSVVSRRWTEHIRPVARAAADGNIDALTVMARDIPGFVEQIDRVVLLIEEDLEQKVRWLRATQFALLAMILVVSTVTSWMLRRQLVQPLAHLLKAARSVSRGSFSVRVSHTGRDELGQLGLAFNTMVEEIANMYAHLEDKVEEKTQELTRTNQSLELLYRVSQKLSASDLTLDQLQGILREVEDALELGHSMICISDNGRLPAHPVVSDLTQEEVERWCGKQDCGRCFSQTSQTLGEQAKIANIVVLPLGEAGGLRGALPILLRSRDPLPADKARLIETVGHHVSNALINMRRTEEKHRLAVLEERAVIARELHDSIAQSLSYLRIQVTRLEKCIEQGCDARTIAEELKDGLSSAYRELRELIATFRLRIDERGFGVALEETIAEFSEKLGFSVQLHNSLSGIVLSGNEEMHVIRIIREALSNIERHAKASRASIEISVSPERRVMIAIRDNGRGFNPADVPENHFGTSIMRDRAHILHGELCLETAFGAGTTILLSFLPQQYRQPTP